MQHINPRFYMGPNTNEISMVMERVYGVTIAKPISMLTISFKKRSGNSTVVSLWSSYAVVDGLVKFEVPDEFRTNVDDFPKGFYDGQVKLDECVIGDVELIKAPGHYVSAGRSIEDKCHGDNNWVEPVCVDPTPPINTCNCTCGGSNPDGCSTCHNQTIVASIGALVEYAGLDEIREANCPSPVEADPEEVDNCESTTNIDKPMVSGIQKSNVSPEYIEDDSDC